MQRRELMARFRSKDTRPEMIVRRALHRAGRRFRLHRKDLPGRPDIVLPKDKVAILVHGCFWHGHEGCSIARTPKTRQSFWIEKFTKNRERDVRVKDELEGMGWRVVILWECDVKSTDIEELLRNNGLIA
nr:DNA mismatch endonuclease Vsr [Erythrobacter litoralis]